MHLKTLFTKRNSQKVFQKNICPELDGQIDLIITRNIKDFKFSKIGVLTPGKLFKNIDFQSRLKSCFLSFPNSRIHAFPHSCIFFQPPAFATLNFSLYICTSNF